MSFKAGDKVMVVREHKLLPEGSVHIVREVHQGRFRSTADCQYLSTTEQPDASWDVDRFVLYVEPAAARSNDPVTSKGKRKVNKYEQAVLAALGKDSVFGSDQRAYTGKEIAQLSGHPLNCITPRFAPLRRKGLIKDSGQRRDKQIVWMLGDGREVTCKVTAHKEEYRSREQ